MMRTEQLNKSSHKFLKSNLGILILFCVVLYGLAIFQDYIFSKVKPAGFYWSDTMLYNIYWLLFIPFIQITNSIYNKTQLKSITHKILYASSTGVIFSLLHILIFTTIFIIGSHIIYPIPHRFSTMFKNAISNQLQITIIAYAFSPFIIDYLKRKRQQHIKPQTQKTITVKNGTRLIKIDIPSIQLITTDRPYTTVYSNDQKYLHDESLKQLETVLDSQTFIRVHRSAIINKNSVSELKSRKNGDYDGILINGQSVRLSRHYRQNWNHLLNH